MDWILFFFILSIVFFFWALLFRFLFSWYLSRQLSKKFEVKPGDRVFSYQSLSLSTSECNLQIENLALSVNFFGLVSPKFKFLNLSSDLISIEIIQQTHHNLQRKHRNVTENIFIQLCVHILILLIKKISFHIKQFSIRMRDLSLNLSEVSFDYSLHNKTFFIEFQTQSSSIEKTNLIKIDFQPISMVLHLDSEPILSLINLEALAVPFGYVVPSLKLKISGNVLTIDSIKSTFQFPRGVVEVTTPALKAKTSLSFPKLSIIADELSGFFSSHLIEIPNLNLDKREIAIKKFKLFNEERLVFRGKGYTGSQSSSDVWNHHLQDFDLMYHTKTGIDIAPFIAKEILPYVRNNIQTFKSLKLPTFSANIETFLLHMTLTDSAKIIGSSSNLTMKNQKIHMTNTQIYFNQSKVFIIKLLTILVKESTFLELNFDDFHFHGRGDLIIASFLMECLYAWRSIAPYVLTHQFDKESLRFPIIIKGNIMNFKFHDSCLHRSVSLANRVLPSILTDSYIREFFLAKRAKEMSLSAKAHQKSYDTLRELTFKEYRQAVEKNKQHKHKFNITFTDVFYKCDAREIIDKVVLIHKFDPTTKLYYPNMNWEMLFGANMELSFQKVEAFAFDIPNPVVFGNEFLFKGPVVIGEPKHKEDVELHYKLDGQDYVSTKNPIKLRLYTDMEISCNDFHYYYADCLMPIFQELSLCAYSTFPHGVDPSQKLVWWDLFRAYIRGNFLLSAKCFDARFMGTRNYRDLSDFMPIRLINTRMRWKEGDVLLTADKWVSPRVYNWVEGPISMQLANMNWTYKFHWISTPNNNPKKYIVFPDVSHMFDPGFDTYKDFRATEIFMDDSVLTFSKKNDLIPSFTLDLAHFEWFAQPMLYFFATSHRKCQYVKKFGAIHYKRPPKKYFLELKRTGWLRIAANVFVFRIFDHFPICGSSQEIQGSSIDLHLNEFKMKTFCDMTYSANKFTTKYNSESISINATDLAHYASVDPQRTPSFITMVPVSVDFGDQANIGIHEITFHFNQFLLRYIQDFMKTTENIRQKFSKPKSPFAEAAIEDYPINKIELSVNIVRLLFVSLESDLQAMGIIDRLKLNLLNKYDPLNNPGSAIHVLFQQMRLILNCDDPDPSPLLTISGSDIFTATSCSTIMLHSIECNGKPMDLTALNSILDECFTNEKPQPKNEAQPPNSEGKLTLIIPSFSAKVSNNKDFSCIDFTDINASIHNCPNTLVELSLLINNVKIINNDRDAFTNVVVQWKEQSIQKAGRPLINLQLKMPPKISGAYIFSQVEINIEPTMVCYDAKFWDDFIVAFKAQMEQKPKYGDQFMVATDNKNIMPFQTFDQEIFPKTEGDSEDLYNSTNKSIKMRDKQKDNMQTMMMMRYFRLNPISMNVSYRNPDNKILSEINNFQGQLHEIIYHDLSVSFTDLVEKLMSDIARDMIPQFIKHFVGIKRPDKTQEQLVEEWLKSDNDKLSQKDKQKKLLFGPKTIKKK